MTVPGACPYILLDDARPGGGPARLYTNPVATICARQEGEVEGALARLREAIGNGLNAAGFLSYEAGAVFEPRLNITLRDAAPLLWFGLFRDWREIAPDALPGLLPDPRGAWIGKLRPEIERSAIICLQEVSREWAGRLHANFAQLGYHFIVDNYASQSSGYMGVALAIPTSILMALIVLYFQGRSFNVLSLAGPGPLVQGGQDADGHMKSCARVTGALGRGQRRAVDVAVGSHQPACGLG